MSTYDTSSYEGSIFVGQPCDFCGGRFVRDEWFVMWRGSRDILGYHRECARAFALHLIKDSFDGPYLGTSPGVSSRSSE